MRKTSKQRKKVVVGFGGPFVIFLQLFLCRRHSRDEAGSVEKEEKNPEKNN